MPTYRTTRCHEHGHPEISFEVARELPVPSIPGVLVDYFETAVAQGTSFRAGQTVLFGGSPLRLRALDGTLGLETRDPDGWTTDLGPALMRVWLQQEVARSVELTVAFPHVLSTAVICKQATKPLDGYFLSRTAPTAAQDSGWFVGCIDPEHDHQTAEALTLVTLLTLSHQHPALDDLLGLPPGTDAVVTMVPAEGGARPFVQIYSDGEEREPTAGSLLQTRNGLAEQAAADRYDT